MNYTSKPVYPDGPHMIYEERQIDKYQSLENVIADLQKALEEGFTSFDVEVSGNEYDGHCADMIVSRRRPETEQEREERELMEAKKAEQQRAREIKEYERLKAKFNKAQ